MHVFKTKDGNLRQIWWIVIFFLVLAALTFPMIIWFQAEHSEMPITVQALIVLVASGICQRLRRRPFAELGGRFNLRWARQAGAGCLIGAGLMIVPALLLFMGGWVRWQVQPMDLLSILTATGMFLSVAIAEEFLFRGFIFQRLISSVTAWPAQLIMAAYFLLIHINNPGMSGTIKIMASVNIFVASVLFGMAFIKTKSLAMPIGIHFMANWVQGTLLGFGVSGNKEKGMLKPLLSNAPEWLTGGAFGIEASVFGLIILLIITGSFYVWYPSSITDQYKSENKQHIS